MFKLEGSRLGDSGRSGCQRGLARALCLVALLTSVLAVSSAFASDIGRVDGWQLETGVEAPSYAMVDPSRTNLNVDIVVLACEEFQRHRVLQLQLYLSSQGPLSPNDAAPGQLTANPRAEVVIDGHIFPAGIFFTEDHAVVVDEAEGPIVGLSERLLDALEEGRNMVVHVEFTVSRAEHSGEIHGEVAVDLRSGAEAVAIVRRCAPKPPLVISAWD